MLRTFVLDCSHKAQRTSVLTIKTLRATRVNHVTRKVNFTDRSAGYQCHSIFLSLTSFTNLLSRADYGNAAAEVKVVVMERGI